MINESEFIDEFVLKLQEELEYEQYCNEQLRNKITNLEYKIKRLEEEKGLNLMPEIERFREFVKGIEEDNKYKIVLDKIKEYLNKNVNAPVYLDIKLYETEVYNNILKLLEEI